jgi:hypothetical protein
MADTRGGVPRLYEAGRDVGELAVLGELLITGRLAWKALGITDKWPSRSAGG